MSKRPFHVVPRQRRVGVAERLERRDLRALQRERARQGDVEDERRHAQEDERQHEPERLQLGQLVLEGPVRELQRARNRAEAAVRFEQAIELRR